jgi:hypothetical protein
MKVTHKSNTFIEIHTETTVSPIDGSSYNCIEFVNEGDVTALIGIATQEVSIRLLPNESYKFGGRESLNIILGDSYEIQFLTGVNKNVKVIKERISTLDASIPNNKQ